MISSKIESPDGNSRGSYKNAFIILTLHNRERLRWQIDALLFCNKLQTTRYSAGILRLFCLNIKYRDRLEPISGELRRDSNDLDKYFCLVCLFHLLCFCSDQSG